MKSLLIKYLIVSLLLISSYHTIIDFGESRNINSYKIDLLNGSWKKEIDGVTVIFVSGSHYQIGYQYGHLLKEEIRKNCRAFFYRCPKDLLSYSEVLFEWLQITNLSMLPIQYQQEIFGLLDGAEMNDSHNSHFDDRNIPITMYCSGISAWGTATQDGTLIHFRSLDSPFFKDPESNTYVHDSQIILIRMPENGYLSLSPSVAGDLGIYGGMNEKGVCISWVSGFSNDIDRIGIPLGIRLKMGLDYAKSGNEVLDILQSNRTNALSYIISDAYTPIGYVNEQTANFSYVGTWDDQTESNYPFWKINHMVRRTNIFINKTLSKTQRAFYNPSLFPYLMSLLRLNQFYNNTYYFLSNVPSSGSWIHYEVLSKELERMHGSIDKTNALPLLQRVYQGKTNIRYAFVTNLFNTGLDPWNQWTAIPETGDISISFAQGEKTADKTLIHHFNLYDLIDQ